VQIVQRILITLLVAGQATAAVITLADFSGSETVLAFNFGDGTAITTQYAAQGITWSGSIVTDQPGGGNFGIGIAINQGFPPNKPLVATFAHPITRVGFTYVAFGEPGFVTLFRGPLEIAQVQYPSDHAVDLPGCWWCGGLTPLFFGVEIDDVRGIDRVVLSNQQYFAMDDFRFEYDPTSIPEPSTLSLTGLGLGLALVFWRFRKIRKTAKSSAPSA
jgi:hypothetical protein